MIVFERAYKSSDGKCYPTLQEAQEAELSALFQQHSKMAPIDVIMGNVDTVVDILTTSTKSRPSARKVNGGRKPRKPKAPEFPMKDEP